jgi:ATP-dependent Clp endopeptidase proteolytic subunit ClpP
MAEDDIMVMGRNRLEDAQIENNLAEAARHRKEVEKLDVELEIAALMLSDRKRIEKMNLAAASQNRIYTFWDAINEVSAHKAMSTIAEWAREDPGCKIQIIFNSPGGHALDGLALFDFLQELKRKGHEVETMALGMAASMGGVLLQAGSRRVMGRHAYLLVHEVAGGAIGKVSELQDVTKFTERLQERLLDILAERATMSKEDIRTKWLRRDWWLDADESLAAGFCDEIR